MIVQQFQVVAVLLAVQQIQVVAVAVLTPPTDVLEGIHLWNMRGHTLRFPLHHHFSSHHPL